MEDCNVILDGSHGRKRQHRPWRKGGRGADQPAVISDDDTSVEEGDTRVISVVQSAAAVVRPSKPRHIGDRSASISQWEDTLARALVILVINGLVDSIPTTIAHRFEIKESSLILQRLGPSRILLILLSIEAMERVFNGGRPIITSSLHLHVIRWTRLMQSTVALLSSAVEEGIPAHAWELPMAE